MPTLEEFTDPYMAAFTPPPRAGPGVCDVCHNAPSPGYHRCWSCSQSTDSVTYPVKLIVPISLYEIPSQLYTMLASYKRSRDSDVRAQFRMVVAATLSRFLGGHSAHIRSAAGDEWDLLTVVPSKSKTTNPHPLERALRLSARLRRQYEPVLEPWRPETIERAQGSDTGYRARRSLDGERVLIIDDTFTSGATLQSAASAITLAGGHVVASVVIGRVIRPKFSVEMGEMWERQRRVPFDFGVCCLDP